MTKTGGRAPRKTNINNKVGVKGSRAYRMKKTGGAEGRASRITKINNKIREAELSESKIRGRRPPNKNKF